MFTLSLQNFFNFIDNAAYRFHYTCNNENSCTISFVWLLGYLVEIPQWERGRDRKHHMSTAQHNEKPRKYSKTPSGHAQNILPVTSLSVTSHPVAMSVMHNGTFCTTTIIRKKTRGKSGMRRTYFRDVIPHHFR
jgi:hypothetical protein